MPRRGLALPALLALLCLALCGPAAAQDRKAYFGAPPAAAEPAEAPGLLQRVSIAIGDLQRRMNKDLADQVLAIKEGAGTLAVFGVFGFAFLYGLFHAAGPGHGKAVVVSYLLSHPASWWAGPTMAGAIALVQAGSAIALVVLLTVLLRLGGTTALAHAETVETASYGLLVALGLLLMARAVVERPHRHVHAHGHDHGHSHDVLGIGARLARLFPRNSALALALAIGVRPCTGAIIVLLFAFANGLLLLGVGATLVMALGVALTLTAIGLGSTGAKRLAERLLGRQVLAGDGARRGIAFAGALVITAIGALLLAGSIERTGWFSGG